MLPSGQPGARTTITTSLSISLAGVAPPASANRTVPAARDRHAGSTTGRGPIRRQLCPPSVPGGKQPPHAARGPQDSPRPEPLAPWTCVGIRAQPNSAAVT